MARTRKRLSDLLVEQGLIDQNQVAAAMQKQQETGKRLDEILVLEGYVTESQMGEALASHYGIERVELDEVIISANLLGLIPEELMQRHQVFPIAREGRLLKLAVVDPFDIMAQDDVRAATRCNIELYLATAGEIRRAYERHYNLQSSAQEVIAEYADDAVDEGEANVEDIGDSPGVKVVNIILMQGIRDKASDIHIEPQESRIRVRYRVDGHLREGMEFPKRLGADIVSRIKVMADLDITNRRQPQDGRLRLNLEGSPIDLRVSTLPTIYGEKVVLRILSKSAEVMELDRLGFQPENLGAVQRMLSQPQGMIIVTGPTGSGKTTTLYSFLHRLNSHDENIITIEDPVEIRVEGINQVNVNTRGGVTFASALRSVLRQDPDIVMVGEMRDQETTEIAVRAALTGHLVLSTMHTNSAAATLGRLVDMGIPPYLLVGTLLGVISQRLVRRICRECQEPVRHLKPVEQAFIGRRTQPITLYRGAGCGACGKSGYQGRIAIEEVLIMNRALRDMIRPGVSEEEVADVALAGGMVTLRETGIRQALAGHTTLEEVIRCVHSVDELLGDDLPHTGGGLESA